MLQNYLPVLVFLIIAILMSIAIVLGSKILAFLFKTNRPSREKEAPFECGFDAFESARMRFDVRFYLVAILFIVFDLEVAFLFPWAVALRSMAWAGIVAMGIFLFLLIIGFVYEWKKGALEWE